MRRIDDRQYRKNRHAERWGDAFTPACECGCGEPVPFTSTSAVPQRFVNRAHVTWWKQDTGQYSQMLRVRAEKRRNSADAIPIEDFRRVVRKMRADKGWSIDEICERGGWNIGQWSSYMYDSDRYFTIGREVATHFFRRLAGLGAPPSSWQLKCLTKTDRKVKLTDHELHRKFGG